MLVVASEPWSSEWWAEARPLAEAHFSETDGDDIEPRRKFKLSERLMALMYEAGAMRLITARRDGVMIGYHTWQISEDVESEGLLVAFMGGWYCAPDNARAAVALFDESVAVLKSMGVQCIFPHHRTKGRGANIGKFFLRRGAIPIQTTYSLWIGD